MKKILQILLISWFAAANIYGYFQMGKDKAIAERNGAKPEAQQEWRTSERELLNSAYLGGAIGVGAGMIKFRHKIATDKENFTQVVPYLMFIDLAIFFGLYAFLGKRKTA